MKQDSAEEAQAGGEPEVAAAAALASGAPPRRRRHARAVMATTLAVSGAVTLAYALGHGVIDFAAPPGAGGGADPLFYWAAIPAAQSGALLLWLAVRASLGARRCEKRP